MKLDIGENLTLVALLSMPFFLSHCNKAEASEPKKHSLYAGVGYHSESYDCPEVCYGGNDLAVIEYTYQHTEYTAAKALHISNYKIEERGYGTNAIFYGVHITW